MITTTSKKKAKQAEIKAAKEAAKEVAKATVQEQKAAEGAATALKKPAAAKPSDEDTDEEHVDFDKLKVATPPVKKKQKKGMGEPLPPTSTPEAEKLPPIPKSVFDAFMDV